MKKEKIIKGNRKKIELIVFQVIIEILCSIIEVQYCQERQ